MNRLVSAGLVVVAAVFAGAPGASAQFVEQSRNVYHIRTCAGPDVQGYARCHAHIVTDARGNPYRRNEVADTARTTRARRMLCPGGAFERGK